MAHETPDAGLGYEPRDAQLKPLIQFVLWLAVGTAITLVATYGMLRGFQEIPTVNDVRDPHPLAAQNDPIPPAPHLETQRGVRIGWDGKLVDMSQRQPFTTILWKDVRVGVSKQLGSYGWVDQQAGIVHVPIERAMELALQRGFPTTAKPGN